MRASNDMCARRQQPAPGHACLLLATTHECLAHTLPWPSPPPCQVLACLIIRLALAESFCLK